MKSFAKNVLISAVAIVLLFSTLRISSALGAETINVATLAGMVGNFDYAANGTGSDARFKSPKGGSVDSAGNFYTVDTSCIRKITPAGVVTTFAGPVAAQNGYCASGSVDGAASDALFYSPSDTAVDSAGNVFVADTSNFTIRKITQAGVVTTFAGLTNASGSVDGTGSDARFNWTTGLAIDKSDNIYVSSYNGCTIRKVTPARAVTTLAGVAGSCSSVDGTGSDARFNHPSGVGVDDNGNIFTVDESGNTVRKVTTAGVVTTIAGLADVSGSADGTGTDARFSIPSWIAVDNVGNVYVTDFLNHTIRKVTQAGVVTTIAGLAGVSGSADGTGTDARFKNPDGIAAYSANANDLYLYVADRSNLTIRKITISFSVPDAPTAVYASVIPGNPQATVSFTAPADNGGSIVTGYTVTSNPGNITASGSQSPITVTGLTNGVSYTFTVTATNVIGNSVSSGASGSVTPTSIVGVGAGQASSGGGGGTYAPPIILTTTTTATSATTTMTMTTSTTTTTLQDLYAKLAVLQAQLAAIQGQGQTSTFIFTRDLSYHDRGNDVKQLQIRLKQEGFFTLNPSGVFGPATLNAVDDYQRAYNLPTTGYVGSRTRRELNGGW